MASDTFTDEQIAQLMALAKRVENPSAKSKNEGKHIRRDFRVVSSDGAHEFALFTRQSSLLPQGFSAGLRWLTKAVNLSC